MLDCPPFDPPEVIARAVERLGQPRTAVVVLAHPTWTPGEVELGAPGPAVAWCRFGMFQVPRDAISADPAMRGYFAVRAAVTLHDYTFGT